MSYPRKSKGSLNGLASFFFVAGVLFLVASFLYELQIAAFIGLGFTFWGAIFTLTRRGKYVESSLLDSTAKSAYSTLDRMINDLKYITQAYYIPSYPQDANLPDYLKNLKDPLVFLSDVFSGKASAEDIVAGKFLASKSPGVFITSPGSGLMVQMERHLQLDFSKIPLHELCTLLPQCSSEILNITKTLDMKAVDNGVALKATGILYESLYKPKAMRSVTLLGCPVVSAVACALAKNTGKTVVIQKQEIFPSNVGVDVLFSFVQG